MTARRLTHSRVLFAGMEVASSQGVDQLNLVSVARVLHVLPTTLQRFIREEELRALVVGEILVTLPAIPPGAHWHGRLERWARRIRDWLAGYPDLACHLYRTCLERDETLALLDGMAAVLAEAGVAAADRFDLAHGFLCFVLGRAITEQEIFDEARPRAWARTRILAADLPHLAASIDRRDRRSPDAYFTVCVRTMIDGIAPRQPRSNGRRRPGKTVEVHSGSAKK